VLLIDDVAGNVVIASTYLRQAGFEVITADSARRALDILRHVPVDVLVCDVRMPDMDGVALARLVRCQPRFADLPIIALTASDDWRDRRRCLAAGMQDFLLKPLALRDLASSIARHCRARPDERLQAQAMSAELERHGDELSGAPVTARILHDINDALGAAIGNLDLALSAEYAGDHAMLRDAFDSCRRVAELLMDLRTAMRAGDAA
jgi:CheY-like chemotaxis protein